MPTSMYDTLIWTNDISIYVYLHSVPYAIANCAYSVFLYMVMASS